MNLKQATASLTLMALVLGAPAATALAKSGAHGQAQVKVRISKQFADMAEFDWGLSHVTKMQVKGIFRGRAAGLFAPGAKITHQESAVAIVRLLDAEAKAEALTAAEIDALLKDMPDQANIASWARASVAVLVKLGVISPTERLAPESEATRLDIAVWLVKALGLEAEARAHMGTALAFKDAALIPADKVGHVAVAVEHKLITGYDDRTFRPQQPVKRIEMAVMLGRADNLVDRNRADELKGTVTAVDILTSSLKLKTADKELSVAVAPEAAIFVDTAEKSLVDLKAGMKVEVKLNSEGQAIFVGAQTVALPQRTISGRITDIAQVSIDFKSRVAIDGQVYVLGDNAELKVNGTAASLDDLKVGDTVRATLTGDLIVRLEAERTSAQETVIDGEIGALNAGIPALNGSAGIAPLISISYVTVNNTFTLVTYSVNADTQISVNGQGAQFSDLRLGDKVKATVVSNALLKVAVTR